MEESGVERPSASSSSDRPSVTTAAVAPPPPPPQRAGHSDPSTADNGTMTTINTEEKVETSSSAAIDTDTERGAERDGSACHNHQVDVVDDDEVPSRRESSESETTAGTSCASTGASAAGNASEPDDEAGEGAKVVAATAVSAPAAAAEEGQGSKQESKSPGEPLAPASCSGPASMAASSAGSAHHHRRRHHLHPAMEAPRPRTGVAATSTTTSTSSSAAAAAAPASVRPPILRRPRIAGSQNRLGLPLAGGSSGAAGRVGGGMSRTLSGGAALHLVAAGGRGGAHYRTGAALLGASRGDTNSSGVGGGMGGSVGGTTGTARSSSTPQLRGILRRSSVSDPQLTRPDAAAHAAAAASGGTAASSQANATFDPVPSSSAGANASTPTPLPLGRPAHHHRDSREELRLLMEAPVLDWTAIRKVQARHYSRSHSRQSTTGSRGGTPTLSSASASASLSTAGGGGLPPSGSAIAASGRDLGGTSGSVGSDPASASATPGMHDNSGSISDLSYGGLPSAQALLASSHASISGGSRSSGGGGGIGTGGIGGGASSQPGRNASWGVVGHHQPPQHNPRGSTAAAGGADAMSHHSHGPSLMSSASVQRNESFGGGPHHQGYPHPPHQHQHQHQRRRTVTDIFAQAAGESRSSAADMFTRLLNAGPCPGSSSSAGSAASGPMGTGTASSHLLAPPVPRNTGLVPRCGTGSSGTMGLSTTAGVGGGGVGESHPGRDSSDGGSCSAGSTVVSDGNESEASAGGRRSAGLVLARRPSPGVKRSGSSGSQSRGGGPGLVLAKNHSKQSVTSLGSIDSGGSSRSGCSGSGSRRGLVLAKSTENLGASRPTPSTITVGGVGTSLGMSRTSGMPGSLGSLGSLGNPIPRLQNGGERGGESDIGMSPSSSSSPASAGVKRSRGSGLVLTKQPGSEKKAKPNEKESDDLLGLLRKSQQQ